MENEFKVAVSLPEKHTNKQRALFGNINIYAYKQMYHFSPIF